MRFWTRRDGLEERLRTRHQARSSFVRDVAARMSANAPRRSAGARPTRFALVFAVLAVVGLAAFGGFGYAASGGNLGILGPVHIVGKAVNGNGNGNGNGKGKSDGGTTTSSSTDTSSSSTETSSADTNTSSTDTKSASAGGADNDPGNSGNTPADDQYKPGCGQGDKNHTHTGPPGNHNGFPGKCPDH